MVEPLMGAHVALEQNACIVCGQTFDTGTVLLHRRLEQVFDPKVVTAWGMCPEDMAKREAGFIALVAIDDEKSKKMPDGNVTPAGAYRTGDIAHIRREAFERVFNVPVPTEGVCFTEPGVIARLQAMTQGKA